MLRMENADVVDRIDQGVCAVCAIPAKFTYRCPAFTQVMLYAHAKPITVAGSFAACFKFLQCGSGGHAVHKHTDRLFR